MFKKCSECCEFKSLDEFANAKKSSDGKQWKCKECQKLYRKLNKAHISQQQKEYRKINSEKIFEKRKIYIAKNIEKIREKNKLYSLNNKEIKNKKQKERRINNPEKTREIAKKSKLKHRNKILVRNKQYRINNKEKLKAYHQRPEVIARKKLNKLKNKNKINANRRHQEKLKRNTDPLYKLITNQRTRITGILKKHKTNKTLELIGCSAEFLRNYLENRFQEDMSWENYGKYGWHVDHIIPCSSFDLTDVEQQHRCFHYTNLQPMWAEDNLRKSNKIYA